MPDYTYMILYLKFANVSFLADSYFFPSFCFNWTNIKYDAFFKIPEYQSHLAMIL